MRIALTVDPELPVPPERYGGIERVVDLLARELTQMGHQVTLFANPRSSCPVALHGWPGARSSSRFDTLRNSISLTKGILSGSFDIVHSCSRLAYMLPIIMLPIPKLMNYHRRVSRQTTEFMHRLSRGTLEFSTVGRWMAEEPGLPGAWHAVPNCVSLSEYIGRMEVSNDAPLVFLGRIEEIKGPHIAIEVAKKAKRRLVIAGNIESAHEAWFNQYVRPHIDGEQIRYIGPVDNAEKNTLLGSAGALLMPILWEEPFGLVMAEAMACGTPVIAFNRGAAPEIVSHGETGFVVETADQMVSSVNQLLTISRKACRSRVEKNYSEAAVAMRYCEIYEQIIARVRGQA